LRFKSIVQVLVRLGHRQLRALALERGPVVAVVELDERVARLHAVRLVDQELLDPAGNPGADRDVLVRGDHVARARQHRSCRRAAARLDPVGVADLDLARPARGEPGDERGDQRHDQDSRRDPARGDGPPLGRLRPRGAPVDPQRGELVAQVAG
jgi:hypothetical protein